MVCAAGGLPGELHKLWRADRPGSLPPGIRLFLHGLRNRGRPRREDGATRSAMSIVMVGDGSYLMLNSEIATSRDAGAEADDRGAGQSRFRLHQPPADSPPAAPRSTTCWHSPVACLHRFPRACRKPGRDRRARASGLAELEQAVRHAARRDRTTVIVIDTDPEASTEAGGHWWDVAVPEVSTARRSQRRTRRIGRSRAGAQSTG